MVTRYFPHEVPQKYSNLYPLNQSPQAKLHPDDGCVRDRWVENQNAPLNYAAQFEDA
ncbi:hypothetical protein [Sulfitobacter sp.]|uniref:hypothetical protein n=1 Tax=Sulfitobacter sp. TaxID=1903071 RepID=UPI0030023C90